MCISMALKQIQSYEIYTVRNLQNLNLRNEGEMIIKWQPNHKAF